MRLFTVMIFFSRGPVRSYKISRTITWPLILAMLFCIHRNWSLFVKVCYFLCIVLTSVDELLNYLREYCSITFTAISFSVSPLNYKFRKQIIESKKNSELVEVGGVNDWSTREPLTMAKPPDRTMYAGWTVNVVWPLGMTKPSQRVSINIV